MPDEFVALQRGKHFLRARPKGSHPVAPPGNQPTAVEQRSKNDGGTTRHNVRRLRSIIRYEPFHAGPSPFPRAFDRALVRPFVFVG
jgi:hypothetical protein